MMHANDACCHDVGMTQSQAQVWALVQFRLFRTATGPIGDDWRNKALLVHAHAQHDVDGVCECDCVLYSVRLRPSAKAETTLAPSFA